MTAAVTSMPEMSEAVCTVCGQARVPGQVWFLLADSPWEDKLRILHWQNRLANREGIYRACSPAHVQELVSHWMAMGTLDYPFANTGCARPSRRTLASVPVVEEPDTSGVRQVGEIAVHRGILSRVLEEDPDSLQIILDELSDVLERETAGDRARFESAARLLAGPLRQM